LSRDRSSPVKVSNDRTTAVSCPANANSSIRLRCHYSAAATYCFSYTAGRDGATRRA
jgi:hypothetical protein